MGCKCSTTAGQVQHAPPPESHPERESLCEKPKPLIFAIIRNGHEVVRGGLRDIESFLQRNELELATAEWEKFRKWFHMHRRMELGAEDKGGAMGFLRLLDKHCDNIATKENFYEGYNVVDSVEEELNAAFETNDMFQIRGFFYDYKDAVLALLKREDEILMPQIDDMAKRGLNLRNYMQKHVLGAISNSFGFETFVRYAGTTLEYHHGGMPRVRTYGYALWAVATRKQWDQWKVWIQESVSKESFQELETVILMDK